MNSPVNVTMKHVVALLLVFLVMPFAVADSVSPFLSSYEKSQKKFLDFKEELKDCELADDNCDDIKDDLLDAAIPHLRDAIALMQAYVTYAGKDTTALEQALDDLQYADSKEEYDAILADVKVAWASLAGDIKKKAVEDLFASVDALVDKGEIIDAKLECGIDALDSSTSSLDSAYTSFSADIAKADEQLDAVEELLASKNLDEALVGIRNAQNALKSSQTSLASARDALTAKGGTLCAEVVIEDDDDDADEDDDTDDEEEDAEEETAAVEEDVEEEQDLDELLSDYDLDSYYEDAQDAIETLTEYIEEQQDNNYDTSKAEVVLTQAEGYLKDAEKLVLGSGGTGAISRLLNAQQTAVRGMNSEYYKAGSGSSSGSATADYDAFVACMEGASYSYQRDACYEDYAIDGDTQTEINDCLAAANAEDERLDCYSEAETEAEKQAGDDEEALRDRLSTLENTLDDLEDEVTALYDELSDSGESSTSDDYKDVDTAIDTLLDDVQEANQGYLDDLDDIETKIDLGDENEADDLLDDVEDEVADYIEDMEAEVADIQQDIDAL